jgi:hypothetical protein
MRTAAALLAIGAALACTDAKHPTEPAAPNESLSLIFRDGTEIRQNLNGTATILKNGKPIVTVRHSGLFVPTTIAGMVAADDPCMFDAQADALDGNCNTPPTLNGGTSSGGGSYSGNCISCGDQLAKYLAAGWAAGMTTSTLMEMAAGAVSPYAVSALGGAWVYVGYLLWRYYQCQSAYLTCVNNLSGGGSGFTIVSGSSSP